MFNFVLAEKNSELTNWQGMCNS